MRFCEICAPESRFHKCQNLKSRFQKCQNLKSRFCDLDSRPLGF
ncbi:MULTISPECIES: hypothetical protein [unclassified Helicobacter]|nr:MULTISPECIES: hypothetical protein [unclassified Helicobacter]